jgi:hypothetical protein
MPLIADMITGAAKRSRSYAERILKDVTPANFARKATVGGTVIDSNHPAWVYGHLALYPARALQMAGLDPKPAAVSSAYAELFKDGTPCLDDPKGTIYPPMAEVTAAYFKSTDAALEALAKLPDDAFAKPNAEERYRQHFPVVGGACLFFLNNHAMMHLGQISAWRRAMGLGPA